MRGTKAIGPIAIASLIFIVSGCGERATPIPSVGPTGPIRVVSSGHSFTEGPAVDAEGRVYFSDLKEEKIFRVSTDGRLTTFVEESRRANGLMVQASHDRLLACESGAGGAPGVARVVAFDLGDGAMEVVVAGHDGRPFNRVNDLVIDREGGLYFTDILEGAPGLPQEETGVYYAAPDGTVKRLVGGLDKPNGVVLSPDETALYVLAYGSNTLLAYDVIVPGTVGEGRRLATLPKSDENPDAGGDGLTVDTDGRIYAALPGLEALAVFTPDGALLGLIPIPEAPSNVVFGGPDRKTLYVTARSSLYALPMEATGHVFGLTGLRVAE